MPYLSLVYCEKDVSPVVQPQSKNSIISGRESASLIAQSTKKAINQSDKYFINFKNSSKSPSFSFKKRNIYYLIKKNVNFNNFLVKRKNSTGSKSFDELQNRTIFFEKNKKHSSSVKKFTIGTFSLSQKSFYPMYSSSAALSIRSNISNINGTYTCPNTKTPSNFSNEKSLQNENFNNKSNQSQNSLRFFL